MRDLWDHGSLWKILLIGIFIALLGIAPLSKTVTAGLEGARRAQEGNHPAGVAANLAAVAEQQPWRTDLWEPAGHAALAAGNPHNAAIYFSRAAAQGALSPQGYLAWGDAEWQMGNPDTSVQIWRIAEKIGIALEETLPRQAEVYRTTGNDEALIENLKAQIENFDGRPPTADRGQPSAVGALVYELGMLLVTRDPNAARPYLQRAAELDPAREAHLRPLNFAIQRAASVDDPVYSLMAVGQEFANQGEWVPAARAFVNAIHLNPEYAEAWAYYGEMQQHFEGEDSLASLARALELDPESLAANTFLSLYWQRQGDLEKARTYLKTALKIDPRNPALLAEMGNLVALEGEIELAQDYYRQAIELTPNDPQYLREFIRFSLAYGLNLRTVVLPLARQIVMLNPRDPQSLDVMGEVLFHLGDLLNAERFYLRALARDPQSDQIHLHLGYLYDVQGKSKLAAAHYTRALDLTSNPATEQAIRQALDRIP